MIWPTDNEWGVPELRLDRQGSIVPPVLTWGSRSRKAAMTGTWVFYCDDYKFSALARAPLQLIPTRCHASAELNFSLFEHTPRAEVVWRTYQKRAASRAWQEAGIGVFVDLNVPERHHALCMLGVPRGWSAFSTRGYAGRPEALRDEWALARDWAGDGLILLVFGGGPSIEALCLDLPGALYCPSHLDVRMGIERRRQ